MKKWTILTPVAAVALAATFSAHGQTTLTEILFNEDGTSYDQLPNTTSPISAPGVSVTSGFGPSAVPISALYNYLSGLGTLQYTVTGSGTHDFVSFVDAEANYANGPFHDNGAIVNPGSAPSYLSWEIGNPNTGGPGSIGNNAAGSTPGSVLLDDANDVAGGNTDIALALGFDFTLGASQTATIDLSLSSTAPGGGFYLEQGNGRDNGADKLFYSGSLAISSNGPSGPPGVPDNGATWFSLLLGLTGLAAVMKFERNLLPRKG
jgi:hypothetical protein